VAYLGSSIPFIIFDSCFGYVYGCCTYYFYKVSCCFDRCDGDICFGWIVVGLIFKTVSSFASAVA
jgi:hypothetical protein